MNAGVRPSPTRTTPLRTETMWFKRKPRNKKRRKKTHILDVKLRSRQANSSRTRATVLMVGVSVGTVFALYLLWRAGDWALDRLVYKNPAFNIQYIDISTDGDISPRQLLLWSRLKRGENLVALDLGRVKRDLEWVANIESVSVERVPPRTLRVRARERTPVARVSVPRMVDGRVRVEVYQLDAKGYVMRPLRPSQCRDSVKRRGVGELPRIVGFPPGELRPGHQVMSQRVRAALDLVQSFDQSPMAGIVDVAQVDVGQPGVLVLQTRQGVQATFGRHDQAQQLRRWRVIHDLGLRQGRSILSLDLSVSNNIPVRWRGDVPQPASARGTGTAVAAGQHNV